MFYLFQARFGWFGNPIFGCGNYRMANKEMLINCSGADFLKASRSPVFTDEEMARLNGINMLLFFG